MPDEAKIATDGLTSVEAARRLRADGPNVLPAGRLRGRRAVPVLAAVAATAGWQPAARARLAAVVIPVVSMADTGEKSMRRRSR
ncbi:hypothetical protein IOD16_18440 [Saccharothrix sp. 6-C]|uniref:cation-transporting P-type ATPase n=1 Tax=Saccharothrix sp. 6-C TaxID=2781735 RepID=UPI001917607B|nr:cation-transporting P-type ATPase [Saccharothrix sp. 6-C]QQQ80185.1 hypothetical protein IOD16_18440 [Saccharothrix sp. 6-C]